jgi:hypothetical protein
MTNPKKSDSTIHTGGGAYIEGKVDTGGGDFVGRDQNKAVIGSVSGGAVVQVGNGSTVNSAAQQSASLADLTKLVAEIRAGIQAAKLDEDTMEAIEGQFKVVEKQLEKPEPKKALVLPSLETTVKYLTAAVTAGEAVTKLIPMAEKAVAWAQQVLR